jgi:DNA helicase-2/ATP-dependent DNA helicase PcrA
MLAGLPAAWTGRAAKPRTITPAETRFRAGDRVLHPSLGEGMVVSSVARDDDEEVTVAFPDKGVKKLMASFAKLARA